MGQAPSWPEVQQQQQQQAFKPSKLLLKRKRQMQQREDDLGYDPCSGDLSRAIRALRQEVQAQGAEAAD